ncbi:phosphate-starvation-inducible PsiE family protein, partial [Streptomyces mirabilis]|uniref:phosphate-starvation-inducible PsiE family protein n=1 Tax=Streptomyces mirabilis TaxID=68239 RepID=UPI0036D812E2
MRRRHRYPPTDRHLARLTTSLGVPRSPQPGGRRRAVSFQKEDTFHLSPSPCPLAVARPLSSSDNRAESQKPTRSTNACQPRRASPCAPATTSFRPTPTSQAQATRRPPRGALHACLRIALDNGLVLFIVAELLHTVRLTILNQTLDAEPFLVVGLIAGIRKVLIVTAEAEKS